MLDGRWFSVCPACQFTVETNCAVGPNVRAVETFPMFTDSYARNILAAFDIITDLVDIQPMELRYADRMFGAVVGQLTGGRIASL